MPAVIDMVLIEGIIFVILSLFNIREKIVEVIPKNIKIGISAGLGMFIIRTALTNAKIINPNYKGFGDLSQPATRLALIGVGITLLLSYLRFTINGKVYRIRGALLLSIVITTIIGIFMVPLIDAL